MTPTTGGFLQLPEPIGQETLNVLDAFLKRPNNEHDSLLPGRDTLDASAILDLQEGTVTVGKETAKWREHLVQP